MLYQVQWATIINSKICEKGEIVEIDNAEYAQGLLDDGNIVQYDSTQSNRIPVEAPSQPPANGGTADPVPLGDGAEGSQGQSAELQQPSISDVVRAAALENNPPSSDSSQGATIPPIVIQ